MGLGKYKFASSLVTKQSAQLYDNNLVFGPLLAYCTSGKPFSVGYKSLLLVHLICKDIFSSFECSC